MAIESSTDNMPTVSASGLKLPWPTLVTGICGFAAATGIAVAAWVQQKGDVGHLREQVSEVREGMDKMISRREELIGGIRETNAHLKGMADRLDRIERKLDSK